jgi:adenylate kinase family enzyme
MKILLLGLSASGKSTAAKIISEKYGIVLIEADDEVEKYNGGIWPHNDEIITKVFKATNKKVVNQDNIIYVTSWMTHKTVKKFYDNGFIIIEMHADFDELIRRKKIRDNITLEKIEKFKLTFIEYHNTLLSDLIKPLYRLSIDTTMLGPEEIINRVAQSI